MNLSIDHALKLTACILAFAATVGIAICTMLALLAGLFYGLNWLLM